MLNSPDFIDLWSVLQEEFKDVLMTTHNYCKLILVVVKLIYSPFRVMAMNVYQELKVNTNLSKYLYSLMLQNKLFFSKKK